MVAGCRIGILRGTNLKRNKSLTLLYNSYLSRHALEMPQYTAAGLAYLAQALRSKNQPPVATALRSYPLAGNPKYHASLNLE